MKALIIASGLKDVRGHNLSYTNAVANEMRKRGFDVTVFANKNLNEKLTAETGFRPIFSHGSYDFPPGNGRTHDLLYMYLQSRIFAYELHRALYSTKATFDLIFCHTVSDFELIGLNRCVSFRGLSDRLSGHVMVLQRLTPRFGSCAKWKLTFHPYWRIKPHYLNALRSRKRGKFSLFTDSELLSNDYARIYRSKIVTLPLPIIDLGSRQENLPNEPGGSVLQRYELDRDGSVVFGYLGDSRNGKGFSLLPTMIRSVLTETAIKVRFVIQCSAPEYSEAERSEGYSELQAIAGLWKDRLTLIDEKVSEHDYAELLRFVDVMLIPYSSPAFVEGTSNIFAQALSAGKPVIVSSGTWMANEAEKAGSGLEFRTEEVDDFAEKVLLMVARYQEFEAKAQAFRAEWQGFHNPKVLVDILVQEAQLA